MLKKILLVILAILVVIQFFRPKKNQSDNRSQNITGLYPIPPDVGRILTNSCADCHSNKTVYPWYAEIEPVGWWLNNHIVSGKRHFNLDSFTGLRIAFQKKKMEDCIEQLKDDDMPLESYTLIHRYARLSETDKEKLTDWFQGIINEIKSKYPADSLVLPKRRR